MAKVVQVRRGTTAALSSITGAEGELFVDTDKETLTVHNNYQAGGFPLLREDLNNLADASIGVAKIAKGSAAAYDTIRVNPAGTALETAPQQLIGWGYKRFGVDGQRENKNGGNYFTNFTLTYTKKITNSRLLLQSYLFGEHNGHNHRLEVWNSVDGFFSRNGYQLTSTKLDEGGYTSSDFNSTPGSAFHQAITSKITAGTAVEFRWYSQDSAQVVLGGSYNTSGSASGGSWEHAACWMVVQELYDGS